MIWAGRVGPHGLQSGGGNRLERHLISENGSDDGLMLKLSKA